MAKRSTSAALVVVVMLWLTICFAEDKTEDGTLKDIKEKSKSWGNWASDKFSEGLDRFSQESHEAKKRRDVIETVGEAASTATAMMNSAGFARLARHCLKRRSLDPWDYPDKAKDAYDEAKRRINLAKKEASDNDDDEDGDNDPRGMVQEGMNVGRDHVNETHVRSESKGYKVKGETGDGKDKAEDNYNEAKEKEQELKGLAQEKLTEDAKNSYYEVAKDNVSRAAGDLGTALRDQTGEL